MRIVSPPVLIGMVFNGVKRGSKPGEIYVPVIWLVIPSTGRRKTGASPCLDKEKGTSPSGLHYYRPGFNKGQFWIHAHHISYTICRS